MNVIRLYIRRSLRWQPLLLGLGAIGILLSITLMTTLGLTYGQLKQAMIDQAKDIAGTYHAILPNMDEEAVQSMKKDERFEQAGLSLPLGTSSTKEGSMDIVIEGFDDIARHMLGLRLSKGDFPKQANEIALEQQVIEGMGMSAAIGDHIVLQVDLRGDSSGREGLPPLKKELTFKLSGILENAPGSTWGHYGVGLVTPEAASKLLPVEYHSYSAFLTVKEEFHPLDVIRQVAADNGIKAKKVMYNDRLLQALGYGGSTFSDTGLSWILIGTIILATACLIIYNVFHISIQRRSSQFGILSVLGATKRQIRILVLGEALVLCVAVVPIGWLLGWVIANSLAPQLISLLNPELFGGNSKENISQIVGEGHISLVPFIISGSVALVATGLSVLGPARAASRVMPITAAAGQASIHLTKQKTINRKLPSRFVLLWFARMSINRNRARTIATMLSIFIGVVVFITVQSFTQSIQSDDGIDQQLSRDYALYVDAKKFPNSGFSDLQVAALAGKVRELHDMRTVRQQSPRPARDYGIAVPSGVTAEVFGYNEAMLRDLRPLTSGKADWEAIERGDAVAVINPMKMEELGEIPNYKQGDRIKIGDHDFVVGAVVRGHAYQRPSDTLGYDFIMSDQVYNKQHPNSSLQFVDFLIGANSISDADSLDRDLQALKREVKGASLVSYKDAQEDMLQARAKVSMLGWIFIGIIIIIAGLNMVNTLYTNIHTRMTEFGMLQAIGMQQKQLRTLIRWEAAIYGIGASIPGALIGGALSILLRALDGGTIEWNLPANLMAIAVMSAILLCLIASILPLRKLEGAPIVERLRSID